jgi:hypothetical protein
MRAAHHGEYKPLSSTIAGREGSLEGQKRLPFFISTSTFNGVDLLPFLSAMPLCNAAFLRARTAVLAYFTSMDDANDAINIDEVGKLGTEPLRKAIKALEAAKPDSPHLAGAKKELELAEKKGTKIQKEENGGTLCSRMLFDWGPKNAVDTIPVIKEEKEGAESDEELEEDDTGMPSDPEEGPRQMGDEGLKDLEVTKFQPRWFVEQPDLADQKKGQLHSAGGGSGAAKKDQGNNGGEVQRRDGLLQVTKYVFSSFMHCALHA